MATEPPLGTRIKRARERKRWSQRQLAEALQVDRKTIDNWENGRTSPRSSIGAIEEILGVRLDAEPESPRLSRRVLDAIRAEYPDQQDAAIAAVEEALGLTAPTAAAEEEPSPRSRRAG